jgi:hypothetical protein
MEAVAPLLGAEGIAVGSVTVTPVEADVASVEVDVPSIEADVPSVVAGVPSEVVDVPSAAVDVASEAVDMPSVEAGMATVEAQAEAVPMVVDAGRFRHNSKLSRPTAFAVGRFVDRHRLGILERFWGLKSPFLWEPNHVMRGRGA